MSVIIPFTPPRAPEPEPEAIVRFGDVEIRIGLTYLQHLILCGGWSDPGCTVEAYRDGDRVMADGMEQIQRAMWAEIDRRAGRSMGGS